jgi:hypothetical protein
MARGFPSDLASRLIDNGYTIAKLKQKRTSELQGLGLDSKLIKHLMDDSRPAIEEKVVIKLLHEARSACCICRNPIKPIIIHHIIEWHESKDNSENNLVILCPDHHAEAHSKHGISQTLTPKLVAKLKAEWVKKVNYLDTLAILHRSESECGRWDYVNV